MNSINTYISHMGACQRSKDFCEWLEHYQKAVWHRIGHSRSIKRMKVYETVITQNLVFDLALKKFPSVTIYESNNENKNGSDLIVYIVCGKWLKKFAVQAKIVYSNGKFPMIDHTVGKTGVHQIDLLINYANTKNMHSAYMFYGYEKSSFNDDFGISLADANTIKSNYFSSPPIVKIPKMDELITGNFCKPAHKTLCCTAGNEIFDFNGKQDDPVDENIWVNFNGDLKKDKVPEYKNIDDFEFNPAYLIKIVAD